MMRASSDMHLVRYVPRGSTSVLSFEASTQKCEDPMTESHACVGRSPQLDANYLEQGVAQECQAHGRCALVLPSTAALSS